jgi:hypothetical protein
VLASTWVVRVRSACGGAAAESTWAVGVKVKVVGPSKAVLVRVVVVCKGRVEMEDFDWERTSSAH